MIYKLRRRFILISTVAVLSVVALVFAVILALKQTVLVLRLFAHAAGRIAELQGVHIALIANGIKDPAGVTGNLLCLAPVPSAIGRQYDHGDAPQILLLKTLESPPQAEGRDLAIGRSNSLLYADGTLPIQKSLHSVRQRLRL